MCQKEGSIYSLDTINNGALLQLLDVSYVPQEKMNNEKKVGCFKNKIHVRERTFCFLKCTVEDRLHLIIWPPNTLKKIYANFPWRSF
jgi:hypothetical protein